MLRLALIENLRRVASRSPPADSRQPANYWADRMIEVAAKKPTSLVLALADMVAVRPQ